MIDSSIDTCWLTEVHVISPASSMLADMGQTYESITRSFKGMCKQIDHFPEDADYVADASEYFLHWRKGQGWKSQDEEVLVEEEEGEVKDGVEEKLAGEGARQGEGKVEEALLCGSHLSLSSFPPPIPRLLPLDFHPSVCPSPPRPACLSDSWWMEAVGWSVGMMGMKRRDRALISVLGVYVCEPQGVPILVVSTPTSIIQPQLQGSPLPQLMKP
ncbi:unnamed protein product [Pleuronectes platessa]|uniref:Uncharacterized protein n=1 Tax=Pleuronectes platessa TaxID=8262 RepID=A0A9N7YPK3_PLEPL|nr:unnamed protein product [Pleuronectes platessa]